MIIKSEYIYFSQFSHSHGKPIQGDNSVIPRDISMKYPVYILYIYYIYILYIHIYYIMSRA